MKKPESLGQAADLLYAVRERKSLINQKLKEIEEIEKELKDYIIDNLPKSNATGIAGKRARVTVVKKDIPRVTDWQEVHKYILKTKNFEILQRRLSEGVVGELQKNVGPIPGVGKFTTISVSCVKA